MHMVMNSQPAIALGVVAGGIKGPGSFRQLLDQLGVGGGKAHGEGTDLRRMQTADPSIMAGPDLLSCRPITVRAITIPVFSPIACSLRRAAVSSGTSLGLLGLALLSMGIFGAHQARAQPLSPNQPEAIRVRGIPPAPCPLLVPASDRALQPLRIAPSQVAMKNSMGCLSPADASLYGPDGCPVKLCKLPQGTVPLPQR